MAFVASAGSVARIMPSADALGVSASYGVRLAPDLVYSYESVWRSQPAVRTVVGFLARNIAELGIDVYRRSGNDDREKQRDHPLARVLRNPFPGSKWNQFRLINWTIHEMCLFDCAYWLKIRNEDTGERAVLPIQRRYIEPIGSTLHGAEAYRLHGTRGERILDPDEVVHFHGYNPDDVRQGVSPIETLRQILAEEFEASRYREQMWRNGARVGGYISRPEKQRWSDEARERFKAGWQLHYTGNGIGSGGTPILEDGMTYHPAGITPKDAQYAESRQLTREEVAIAYHINPAMLGLVRGQTAGNMPELHKMLYSETLGPWLQMLKQDLETQLLPDLAPARDVYVEFNLRRKLAGSFEEQAAAISASVGAPWMTRAEARARFDLPRVEGSDELIVPLNVLEGGLASPRDTAPDNPSNEESNGQLPAPKPEVTA